MDVMAKVEIFDVVEIQSRDPDRPGKKDALVHVKAPDGRMRVVTVPAESLTKESVSAAVKADLAKRSPLIGQEIDV